jgi:hypothetical protein
MEEKIDYKKIFVMIADFIMSNWIEIGFEYPELYGLNPVPKFFTCQLRKSIFTTAKNILIKIFTFSKLESLIENPELYDLSLINSYIKSQKALVWSFYQHLLDVDVSVYKNEVY